MIKLAPSVLACDFTRLGEEVQTVEEAGADYIHLDVMDGIFVPSLSIGMPVIQSLRKVTAIPFDVHLMMHEPGRYLEAFYEAGADQITVHAEACIRLKDTIKEIRKLGCRVGVSLNPVTSLSAIDEVLDEVDQILIMTVNPGFGGQKYIESSTAKIKRLRRILDDHELDTDIEVDGGIVLSNVRTVLDAGANVIVAGSAVYRGNAAENVKAFKEIFKEYEEKALLRDRVGR